MLHYVHGRVYTYIKMAQWPGNHPSIIRLWCIYSVASGASTQSHANMYKATTSRWGNERVVQGVVVCMAKMQVVAKRKHQDTRDVIVGNRRQDRQGDPDQGQREGKGNVPT